MFLANKVTVMELNALDDGDVKSCIFCEMVKLAAQDILRSCRMSLCNYYCLKALVFEIKGTGEWGQGSGRQ